MRVFFDTNVVLAAVATDGVCRRLMNFATDHHEVVISQQVIEEYCRYVIAKLKLPTDVAISGLNRLRAATIATPRLQTLPPGLSIRDPDDVQILTAATSAACSLLITGDRDLLDVAPEIHKATGLRVVSPHVAGTLLGLPQSP